MSKVVTAEYDAARRSLDLDEPLEGIGDREKVEVVVTPLREDDPALAWRALENSLPAEQGEDLARAIEELFPPWNN